MELLEYQVKMLFRQVGLPVLPSQRIDHPAQLKHLQIPYPVTIKSQVRSKQRAQLGGVRLAANTIDAVAAAQAIFGLRIQGELPHVLLAEACCQPVERYYLAIHLDRSARRPVLLGSSCSGLCQRSLQRVWVETEFSSYYARRLALQMGLAGERLLAVADIIERMYRLMANWDLDLVEIDPLGIDPAGQWLALEGQIRANEDALQRHPDLVELLRQSNPGQPGLAAGSIALLCNGMGLMLCTLDLLQQTGCASVSCLDVGETAEIAHIQASLERLHQLVMQPADSPIRVVLINLAGGVISSEEIVELALGYQQGPWTELSAPPHLIFRLLGDGDVSHPKVGIHRNLDAAVACCRALLGEL